VSVDAAKEVTYEARRYQYSLIASRHGSRLIVEP
jgi:hypothetical protein